MNPKHESSHAAGHVYLAAGADGGLDASGGTYFEARMRGQEALEAMGGV